MTNSTPLLWPADYNLPRDTDRDIEFCEDVLKGGYDVPYHPKEPPVILDIGACVGAFTRWAVKRWPGATIHCYEPSPRNFALLQRTQAEILSGNPRVHLHNVAVGEAGEEKELTYSPFNPGGDSFKVNYVDDNLERHKVPIIAAASLPKADVLKIDTEGCESDILRGIFNAQRLSEFSAVMMEIHSNLEFWSITANMRRFGFGITKLNQWAPQRSEVCFVRRDLLPADFQDQPMPEKPLVWIATPLRYLANSGKITEDQFRRLLPTYRDPIQAITNTDTLPWRFELALVGGGGVARARNTITSKFYKSKARYLFFVDYDLMPKPIDYIKVLAAMEANNLMVCGGLYTTRSNTNCHWIINFPAEVGPHKDGLLQVLELGTGFKCYDRSAFDKIFAKNPWLEYIEDDTKETEWGFFSMGPVKDEMYWPGKSRWLSEDYWLDWLTRDAGIPIVVDTTVQLTHYDEDTKEIFPAKFPPLPAAVIHQNEVLSKSLDTSQVGGHPST